MTYYKLIFKMTTDMAYKLIFKMTTDTQLEYDNMHYSI
jgi:hypothetical protein